MAAVSKYLTAKNSAAAGGILLVLYFLKQRRRSAALNRKKGSANDLNSEKDGKKERAAVDKLFFVRISRIIGIMVPRLLCKETWYLFLIAVMLVTRTYCDVWMIQNGTMIESAIIGRSTKGFKKYLFNFITAMPVIALVNNFLKLGLNELKLCFRVRLTKHLYDEYLNLKKIITGHYVDHLHNFIFFRFSMGMVDSIIAKYFATVVGYLVVSRPFLDLSHPRHLSSSHAELLEDYYQSGRMLLRMSQALGRIVLAGREMTRLSGFTARITELMRVLKELNSGKYERTMVSHSEKDVSEKLTLVPGSGRIINVDHIIKFDHTPLATPNGDVLIRDMCFEVKSGTNVLVCGPNGCGKSSLFRVLGELWPLFGGSLTKPERGKLFYVPQRPYMTLGSLRDQVIYPDTHEDQKKKGISDQVLKEYLDNVQLGHILEREGSWDVVQDWMDVLSGGEKQRMAMARLFYHKPQFAILDECTSAVSVDVEDYIYSHCRKVGITLFTVSHRKSLWKHHEFYLHMDGRGNYEFKPITTETVEFGS
ncbi:ATP-binding cassette sub-family D member 3a [Garra rufa]|uniref:ATP-binding cassette sub-family D member 3a n=1 Tax=Garra rufa TaxID=137080 RepID=UPI003CCE70E4